MTVEGIAAYRCEQNDSQLVGQDQRLVNAIWYAYTDSVRTEPLIKSKSPADFLPEGCGFQEWNKKAKGRVVRLIEVGEVRYFVTVRTEPGKIRDIREKHKRGTPWTNIESDGVTRVDLYPSISQNEPNIHLSMDKEIPSESVVLPRQRSINTSPVINIPRDAATQNPQVLNPQNLTLIMEDLWQRLNQETWLKFGYKRGV